jgi:hypothetical protein
MPRLALRESRGVGSRLKAQGSWLTPKAGFCKSEAPRRTAGGQRFCRADYQRRERQRQMKNDEARPSPEAAREEFFPGV